MVMRFGHQLLVLITWVPGSATAVLPPAWTYTVPFGRTDQMSGMPSLLASGVPCRKGMLLLDQPVPLQYVSVPSAELAAEAREFRSTASEFAAMPLRRSSRPES